MTDLSMKMIIFSRAYDGAFNTHNLTLSELLNFALKENIKISPSRDKIKPVIARGFKHLVPVQKLMLRKTAFKKSKVA